MKKVLFITYYFPPYTSSGVFRPLKFVKYLMREGSWEPIILTLNQDSFKDRPRDYTLSKNIPEELKIYYANSLEPNQDSTNNYKEIYREAHIPDHAYGSFMHFVIKALQIIKEQEINLIFCTIPPYTMGLIGTTIKEITNIPMIVDYRDGWVNGNMMNKFRTEEGKHINTYLENKLLQNADAAIFVNREVAEVSLKQFPKIKQLVAPNGYDLEDFNNLRKVNTKKFKIGNKKQIVWCGHIYNDYVDHILKMAQAINVLNEDGHDLEFVIAGTLQSEDILERLEFNYYSHIRFLGNISYEDSILLTNDADINFGVHILEYSIGSRFYNLIPTFKPIIAFYNTENKYIPRFFENYPLKELFSLDASVRGISNGIVRLINSNYRMNGNKVIDSYKEYSRENNAYKLIDLFNQISLSQ
ncbi:hypothetical protein J40TS1_47450 [Paenibacillus montaniterrae]|uniref:Glycosyltransferase subfamily 4-like N-terminal domain-containing protein n=1 Tax=Paenibacillus montaniterrae TaxID=429341 RepID=A0A920D111_9BACL|nr:hypothetical protein [Paenibacillus montaniterrae]GIP19103.1 hypothetical protein J40TS1_47450 [Paenibacillus montaniterrae]